MVSTQQPVIMYSSNATGSRCISQGLQRSPSSRWHTSTFTPPPQLIPTTPYERFYRPPETHLAPSPQQVFLHHRIRAALRAAADAAADHHGTVPGEAWVGANADTTVIGVLQGRPASQMVCILVRVDERFPHVTHTQSDRIFIDVITVCACHPPNLPNGTPHNPLPPLNLN